MKNLTINKGKVKLFFNGLWPSVDEGLLAISSKDLGGLSSKFFKAPPGAAVHQVMERWVNRDIWYSVGLLKQRPEKGRGTEADVIAIPGLWFDLDVLGGIHKEKNLPTKEEALIFQNELPSKPSILIWSGGGFQLYWIFKEPLFFHNEEGRGQAKQLSERFQLAIIARAKEKGWRLDKTARLEHLLRIPGTYNHKADPVPVKILELNNFRYEPNFFEEFLIDEQPQDEPREAGPYVGAGRTHEIVERCVFLKYCKDNAANLPEPSWWCMVCSLCFEDGSSPVIHELSQKHPGYTEKETEKKIMEAMKQSGPMTCRVIQETTGFDCPPGGCGVKCPVHLLTTEWEAPVLLDDYVLPEMDPLPGIIGEVSKAVATSTETPLELSTALALATVGAACQGKFIVMVKKGYSEPVSLWVNVALESGNRKSSVLVEVTHPLTSWESNKRLELETIVLEAESKRKNQEARIKSLRVQYGKAQYNELDEIEEEIRKLETSLVKVPVMPKVWVQDITPEHLGTMMSIHDERMAIVSAEGGIFHIIAGRYSNGVPNLDLFLQGHSGDPVRVDRGSRESIYLEHPSLTMGLSPQPEVLRNIADSPGFRGKGLLARFLYLLPKSKLGHRTLETEPVPQHVKDEYEGVIHALLNIEPAKDERANSIPYMLQLTNQAFQEWLEFSRVVERDLREGGRFENITDWGGKLPGAAIRIAGLLHCVEHPFQAWSSQIVLETMQQALGLASIFASHALKVFDLMGADKSLEGGRKVWRWVDRGRFQSFKKRDCYNALKGSFPRVTNIEPCLDVLEERNYIASSKKKTGGRPSVTYTVNPELTKGW